jgi:BolA protein
MSLAEQMTEKLKKELSPQFLELINESHLHGRPTGAETHFKLLVVSDKFNGLSRIDRQRLVNNLFDFAREKGLHALTQKTLSPAEWEQQKDNLDFQSPACRHKN